MLSNTTLVSNADVARDVFLYFFTLSNGTGVIFGMIYFCRWPAIISRSSEWSIFYIIKVSQPKVHHGSVTIIGAAGEFLRRGFEFYRGWFVWPVNLNLHRHLTENDFSLKGGG